jgi:hypothetical protein
MKSARKYTRSSTEDFCIYSLLEVYEISKEINQELHRGLLLIFPIRRIDLMTASKKKTMKTNGKPILSMEECKETKANQYVQWKSAKN